MTITDDFKKACSESNPEKLKELSGKLWDEFKSKRLKPKTEISEEEAIKLFSEKEQILEKINWVALALGSNEWKNWTKESALTKWLEYKNKGSQGFGGKKFFTPRTTEQKVADMESFYKFLESKDLLKDIETNLAYNYIRFNVGLFRYIRVYGTDAGAKKLSIWEAKVQKSTDSVLLVKHGHKSISSTDTSIALSG